MCPGWGSTQLQITLSQADPLTAGNVTVISVIGTNYGPVTVAGSGTSYTITLAHADQRGRPGNDHRRGYRIWRPSLAELDVLPGDFNDDGVVNSQDVVGVRNEWLRINGAKPTIFGDINGDGVVNAADYNDVRTEVGTSLPSSSDVIMAVVTNSQINPAPVRIGTNSPSPRRAAKPSARASRDSIVRATIEPAKSGARQDDQPAFDREIDLSRCKGLSRSW